ncbi:MAG: FG-GAP-like repeat-containing protein [Candidatus Njordarchaeia archaeon]
MNKFYALFFLLAVLTIPLLSDSTFYIMSESEKSYPESMWKTLSNKSFRSSPALGDVDGDGGLDVVVCSDDGFVYVLGGLDGSLLWQYNVSEGIGSSPALGDVDGDGYLEVVFLGSVNVYVLDGLDGSLLWKQFYGSGLGLEFSPVLGDLNGDGALDIIVSGSHGMRVFDGRSGATIWNFNDHAGHSSPVLGDLNGDNKLDVLVNSEFYNVSALNGINGVPLWVYRSTSCIFHSSPALGDLDGDGCVEFVVTSVSGGVFAFDLPRAGFRIYWGSVGGDIHNSRDVRFVDSDEDGLSNYSESLLGTDPFERDSDGDGFIDGVEVFTETDPLNSWDNSIVFYLERFLLFVLFILVVTVPIYLVKKKRMHSRNVET